RMRGAHSRLALITWCGNACCGNNALASQVAPMLEKATLTAPGNPGPLRSSMADWRRLRQRGQNAGRVVGTWGQRAVAAAALKKRSPWGSVCVSTRDQSPAGQIAELQAAGCGNIFKERASGARTDRPELAKAIRRLEPGDVLVVTRLDRLARS